MNPNGTTLSTDNLSGTGGPAPPPIEWPAPSIPRPTGQTRKDIKRVTTDKEDETDYLQLILNARVYDIAIESPLTHAKNLSHKLGNTILLKREDMQPVFSFKCRGAFNKMFHLSPEERARGVIAASAGNHAQGVAMAAQRLGIKATICMPVFAPEIKVANVRRLGAEVVLCGTDFDEAKAEMYRLAADRNLTIVQPFDDKYVIAGQGTIGVEILRQVRQERLDAIFVCCGGGGLLAGIAAYVKRIRPEVKVIGVNTIDSSGMHTSLAKGEHTPLKEVGLFADGSAVRVVGQETFRICNALVDDMVLVSTDEICAAIRDTFDDTRSIVEPAGALGVAGCKKFLQQNPHIKHGVFACVLSGANMNFDRLRFVAERARIGEGRETLLSVIIPEQPGSFWRLYSKIYPRNVTEFSYRYSDPFEAHIFIGFEVTRGALEVAEVMAQLEGDTVPVTSAASGETRNVRMHALDITDNEVAKTHGRYLIGGRSATVTNERLLRFQFPERPGALKRFLSLLESDWNVSLFHYRNHGADIARVLVGMQVPPGRESAFDAFLENLGFPYVVETSNPVYQHFLK
ncbi:threonine deaminase [Blastocladiella emersonii ATCC 22665]|nr:threonine deaminase [Blastocladiella emersonii ATCC 22665]